MARSPLTLQCFSVCSGGRAAVFFPHREEYPSKLQEAFFFLKDRFWIHSAVSPKKGQALPLWSTRDWKPCISRETSQHSCTGPVTCSLLGYSAVFKWTLKTGKLQIKANQQNGSTQPQEFREGLPSQPEDMSCGRVGQTQVPTPPQSTGFGVPARSEPSCWHLLSLLV